MRFSHTFDTDYTDDEESPSSPGPSTHDPARDMSSAALAATLEKTSNHAWKLRKASKCGQRCAYDRFMNLPPELQLMILTNLEFGDIERLRRTSHHFRNLITKPVVRQLFPDLRATLQNTCYSCLEHVNYRGHLIRAEQNDPRWPFGSKCFDCTAQHREFMIGQKYTLGDCSYAWICRWCGYPVTTSTAWNQPEFHRSCYKRYNAVLILFFLLGCFHWLCIIVGGALCWAFYRSSTTILAPTIVSISAATTCMAETTPSTNQEPQVNFIMAFWALVLLCVRGQYLRTYHWTAILESAILGLWVPAIYTILQRTMASPDPPSAKALATMTFIFLNMYFRLLNILGNIVLMCEYKMWRRRRPNVNPLSRSAHLLMTLLVLWTYPQSIEQEYPATWWFGRPRPQGGIA
ncbi:hypothetical protein S40288_02045 [Stachybotrys chartarum IBT 40288]|nr:hypothetical protein S40288_02045 [Stachybotrys chartarum IBT 40288]